MRYLYRMCGDADLAADAAQEAFVRAVDRPPPEGVSRAWLFTVATNELLQDRRTAANRLRLLSVFMSEPVQREPEAFAAMVAADRTRAVRVALDALPPRERAALLMRAEGLAYKEIAAALHTTTGSVGTLLSRGLARLDECLRPMVESL